MVNRLVAGPNVYICNECIALCNDILNDEDFLLVDDICVEESHRRRGIGKALFRYAEAAAEEAGCGRVVLDVYRFNENALAFYRAMGFREEAVRLEKESEVWDED